MKQHLYLLHEIYYDLFCPFIFIPLKVVVVAAHEVDFMTNFWDMFCNLKTTVQGRKHVETC